MRPYRISGLSVHSDLELPGAIPAPASDPCDVAIRRAATPTRLERATACGPTWEMDGERFLLRVPRLARFLITGSEIAVELDADASEHDVSSFLLGTAFGILLHQRGALVLHGAAVARDGWAIAICGASGAGKSTLAAALCRAGCSFAADDICVVALDDGGRPVVLPDGRQLKLWRESIDQLDLGARQRGAVRDGFEKYFIQPSDTATAPPSLSAIYVLREARPPLQAGIESLALPDAMRMLEYEAYRPGLRAKIGQDARMLAQGAAAFRHAKAFRLTRVRGFEHMADTVTSLLAHWDALG